ncbi:MAG: hypothetical protein K1X28_04490 [Parachlamydiales bacterium]|nr:hypothetical protein [Parachlamydiales bacterium]
MTSFPHHRERIFDKLPHKNPYFDIGHAIKYATPLRLSYENDERDRKVKIVNQAFDELRHRQEPDQVKYFHRLAEEFLKEYHQQFQDEKICKIAKNQVSREKIRGLILKQELIAMKYFENFYLLSVQYLYGVLDEV